jgi:alpha-1,2-mannosyltransferase
MRVGRSAPWVLASALGLHLVAIAIWTKALTQLLDLGVYRAGGHAVLTGVPLYAQPLYEHLNFTYPPFAAVVFTPLALIPFGALKVVFSVLNVVALALAIRLCLRELGTRDVGSATVLLTGVLFWLEPVRSTIVVGQVNLLLMLLLLWDVTRPASARWQGAGVGLATGIKLIPGLFIVYLLITRRYRAAGVATGVFVGTVALGFVVAPASAARYWRDTFVTTNRIGKVAEAGNQSLAGVLARLAAPAPHSATVWFIGALLLGVSGLAAAWLAHRRGCELLGVTICGLTSCVVSPFTWNHHWVWLVPCVILLLHLAFSTDRRLLWLPAGLVLLTLDWPVALVTAPDRNTPSTGLIMLNAAEPLAYLTRNLYPALAIALVVLLVRLSGINRCCCVPANGADIGLIVAGCRHGTPEVALVDPRHHTMSQETRPKPARRPGAGGRPRPARRRRLPRR